MRCPPSRPLITKTVYVICEGVNSEPRYLDAISKLNPRCMLQIQPHKHTDPLKIVEGMVSFVKDKRIEKSVEYWCVFDHDDKAERVRLAYQKAKESNSVANRPKVQIALNTPCIEAWALSHYVPPSDIPTTRHQCQKKLEEIMPGYDHSDGAKFNFEDMMKRYELAQDTARSWGLSNADGKEYEASKLAGIHKLVDSIMSA
ncbi:MAG: RloB family protein [Alphaproteobacteria bacterium]|nr:RloB family protein [Alphaproteobacteria bacterium]